MSVIKDTSGQGPYAGVGIKIWGAQLKSGGTNGEN